MVLQCSSNEMFLVLGDICLSMLKFEFSNAAQRYLLCRECRSDRLGVQWISTTCLLVGRLSSAQRNLGGSKGVVGLSYITISSKNSIFVILCVNIYLYSFLKVHKALPGSKFNSVLLNRYKGGNDYAGWHSDDEKLYGSTPEIASVSFGCEREFFLKKKPSKTSRGEVVDPLICRKEPQETIPKPC